VLASRPNPHGLVVVHTPALGTWLERAEKQKGTDLSETEVARIRDGAPAVALRPEQFQAMRDERGYDDLDLLRVYESWREFKRGLGDSDADGT
jgi:hypothetical protein